MLIFSFHCKYFIIPNDAIRQTSLRFSFLFIENLWETILDLYFCISVLNFNWDQRSIKALPPVKTQVIVRALAASGHKLDFVIRRDCHIWFDELLYTFQMLFSVKLVILVIVVHIAGLGGKVGVVGRKLMALRGIFQKIQSTSPDVIRSDWQTHY
jgi:hypothetical protein